MKKTYTKIGKEEIAQLTKMMKDLEQAMAGMPPLDAVPDLVGPPVVGDPAPVAAGDVVPGGGVDADVPSPAEQAPARRPAVARASSLPARGRR